MTLDRRAFLQSGLAGLGALGMGRRLLAGEGDLGCGLPTHQPRLRASKAKPDPELEARFVAWLNQHGVSRAPGVENLVWNFYDPDKKRGDWIYPMLSGKTILWYLARGEVDRARTLADALLPWQQTQRGGRGARSFGAFPSKLENDGRTWRSGDYFYSGDNLVIIDALVRLYEKTRHGPYLNGAVGAGTWITTVMARGKDFSLWVDDHGAPMQLVSRAGDLINRIHVQVEMLWISALKRLGAITAEPEYCRVANRAYEFYRRSQRSDGAFMDHYDPGFPAQPYDEARWRPFAKGQLLADNSLRSALGACRMGDLDAAQRFKDWLQLDDGAVPAYLSDGPSGTHGFEPDAKPYYDVVASGLYRSLCLWLGDEDGARRANAFLKRVQSPNGGFYWGALADGHRPLTPQQTPIVGLWATEDLSQLRS